MYPELARALMRYRKQNGYTRTLTLCMHGVDTREDCDDCFCQ